ncbi:plasmid partitioning protein RepA, partial [Rhizobiaceae sp. 2RAB30]
MNLMPAMNLEFEFDREILEQGELISDKLNLLRLEQYPPNATK